MARRSKDESRTVFLKLRGMSQEPLDSPHQHALGRRLESSSNVMAQMMSKHFLEDPRLMGEEMPPGFSIITRTHLKVQGRNAKPMG